MSIRFRVSTSAAGRRYGAIVHTFRDKLSGKVCTRCLKSYGQVDEAWLKDEAVQQQLKQEVQRFQELLSPEGQVKVKSMPGAGGEQPLAQYYPALAMYRSVWNQAGLDEVMHAICRDSRHPELKHQGELIFFYISALFHFSPQALPLLRLAACDHIFDVSALSLSAYQQAMLIAFKTKSRLMQALKTKLKFGQSGSKYTFYLTKFYFSKSRDKEVPMLFAKLSDEHHIPVDYELFRVPESKQDLFKFLQKGERRYRNIRSRVTLIADTELNTKRSLLALSLQPYDYILIRNLYKLSRHLQTLLLRRGIWHSVHDHKGQRLYQYKDMEVSLSGRLQLGASERMQVKTRIIVICSDSKRLHDLRRLAVQWETANQALQNAGAGLLDSNNSEHGMMQFIRKRRDLNAYTLDFSRYRQQGAMAGFYLIATSLSAPVQEIYHEIRMQWQAKEQWRSLQQAFAYFPGLKFTDYLQGQFALRHLGFVLEHLMLRQLKRQGINLDSPRLKEILHECRLVYLPGSAQHPEWLLKTCAAAALAGAKALGSRPDCDELWLKLGLPAINTIENPGSLKEKLALNLPLNPALKV